MHLTKIGFGLLSLLLVVVSVPAQEADPGTIILDQFGSWRMFHVLKPPEIAFDDGTKPVVYRDKSNYWLNGESPPPSADWMKRKFNDADWLRGPTGMGCRATFVARACLRGKFRVTNPGRAKSLKLTMSYHGGVAVYLNGREVGRKHVPVGAALAEPYPMETFVAPDGKLLGLKKNKQGKPANTDEELRRMALRKRTLEIEIPTRLLIEGVNVLAIEIVRTSYHKAIDEQKKRCWTKEPLHNMRWNTCELLTLSLTANTVKGLKPNLAGSVGLHLWNSSILRTDFALDSGDPCEVLRPITLIAARNGNFSDKVVVGSTKPIRGLKATPSKLRGPGGTIPASALRVRYAVPGGAEYGIYNYTYGIGSKSARRAPRAKALNVLMDVPPAEYATATTGAAGAVAPLWLTVKVPADAKPGSYKGRLTVSCEGQEAIQIPVELTVADWTLPDPDNYQSWTEILQSPDTLQMEYGVPAWSNEHFKLIGRSFRLMREVGSGVLYLPLICCTNYGNEESIVRWVPKGENEYDFDFTALDKYLDVAQKNLGKPKLVCFIVWEIFMLPKRGLSVGRNHGDMPRALSRFKDRMTAPFVTTTTMNPATGKLDRVSFPSYFTDAKSKTQWKKLFDALRARMKKRGLEDTMMLGWITDNRAQKEEFTFWNDVTGDLPWVSHAHWTVSYFTRGKDLGFRTGYNTSIHDTLRPIDPAKGRRYGWKKKPVIHAQQLLRPGWRGEMDRLPASMWCSMTEISIVGGQRGFGRLGGDSWHVIKNKKGRRAGRIYDRYPWSIWGNLELCCSLMSPGPDGAVATAHFEQLREGVQACEARIFIEQALTDEARRARLGEKLAQRCQTALDERVLYGLRGLANYVTRPHYYSAPWTWWFQTGVAGHAWNQSSGWRERNGKLYALAGEVAAKLDVEP